jgi:hypothetical protein
MAQKTQLSPLALPGMVRTFLAKTEAVSVTVEQLYLKTPLMMSKNISTKICLDKPLKTPVELTRNLQSKLK